MYDQNRPHGANGPMVWGALPSLSFRVDGVDASDSKFPIPMVVKGL